MHDSTDNLWLSMMTTFAKFYRLMLVRIMLIFYSAWYNCTKRGPLRGGRGGGAKRGSSLAECNSIPTLVWTKTVDICFARVYKRARKCETKRRIDWDGEYFLILPIVITRNIQSSCTNVITIDPFCCASFEWLHGEVAVVFHLTFAGRIPTVRHSGWNPLPNWRVHRRMH